jgi:hypothetical protein
MTKLKGMSVFTWMVWALAAVVTNSASATANNIKVVFILFLFSG